MNKRSFWRISGVLALFCLGVLALAAPASYTVAGGSSTLLAGLLWVLCWLQSAGSVLLVFF